MRDASSLSQRLSSLSSRERQLISIALALTLLVVLVYGVLMPGLSAARSAENRWRTAATELAGARALASAAGQKDAGVDLAILRATAHEAGFAAVDGSEGSLRVQASGAAALLAWLSEQREGGAFDSVVITPTGTGGVMADIRADQAP